MYQSFQQHSICKKEVTLRIPKSKFQLCLTLANRYIGLATKNITYVFCVSSELLEWLGYAAWCVLLKIPKNSPHGKIWHLHFKPRVTWSRDSRVTINCQMANFLPHHAWLLIWSNYTVLLASFRKKHLKTHPENFLLLQWMPILLH